ncbi:hypothetical protein CP01DC11_1361A, partial [Chlamydia psittaci 01DC11]
MSRSKPVRAGHNRFEQV